MTKFLKINSEKETKRIVRFLQETFKTQHIQNAVIGLSGGIDSITCYYLLRRALPEKNIFPVYLPYYNKNTSEVLKNVISIKTITNTIFRELRLDQKKDKIRAGNIIARVRMIILFDLAKKYNALVCGTENKTEHLLGYFTRFGDGASDIELIRHLYKTQVYQLAKYLEVPKQIINQHPTAGLWTGQTDEKEFGFTYEEADQVLYLNFEKKHTTTVIQKQGFKNTKKIISFVKKNRFKLKTPYSL